MNKQQYKAVAYRFRERMVSITGSTDFPEEQRADVRRLLDLRDRCDPLANRAQQIEFDPRASRHRVLWSTAPVRVQRKLDAKYPGWL